MHKREFPNFLASTAETTDDGRLFAPSAERNAGPIADLLARVAPETGRALEIAAGTGQHAATFAARLPGLHWQPTDVDPTRLASIDAYAAQSGTNTIAPALQLDATSHGWAATHGPRDLILVCNLLHLISETEARTLIAEAAACLAPAGCFIAYGPFKRGGVLISEGDVSFDTRLREHDPEVGYKDDKRIIDWATKDGLILVETAEMPANNLAFVFERPAG